jgi:hypothetical protein
MQNNGALPFNRIALMVGNAVQSEWLLERVKLQVTPWSQISLPIIGQKLLQEIKEEIRSKYQY